MTDSLLFEHLKKNPIFAAFDPYMFQVIERHLTFRELLPNEILFTEGEHGDSMAFVLIGDLSVLKTTPDGKQVKVGRVRTGESIGEMALIDMLSRSATVQAEQRTAILLLNKADFDSIINDYPRIGVEILRGIAVILSIKLRRTSENLSRSLG